jgi:hypothetical protein
MRRLLDRMPRVAPPILVGVIVGLALTFAFGSPIVGASVGVSIAVVLLWEDRLHSR